MAPLSQNPLSGPQLPDTTLGHLLGLQDVDPPQNPRGEEKSQAPLLFTVRRVLVS